MTTPLTLDDLDDLLNFGLYPHEVMVQQAYEDMKLASPKPTYGDGSSPKQNIVENAMAMLQFPEFKMFSKKDYVRFVWNEGHKNEDLLSIHPRKGIDRGMKKTIKTWGEVLRNPIVPRNYLKAMDEGWTGFPSWAISPTISAHELMGNPPRPIPEFGYHFTSKDNYESIMKFGLRAPVYLFYPDSNYHAWVLSGQIDGVFEGDNPDMMGAGMTEKMFNLIMLRVHFDKSEFVPAPYETGDVHDEFYLNSDVSPEDIIFEGEFANTVGYDLMTGLYTPENIGKVPNMKAIVEGYFDGNPDHLRPNPPLPPMSASDDRWWWRLEWETHQDTIFTYKKGREQEIWVVIKPHYIQPFFNNKGAIEFICRSKISAKHAEEACKVWIQQNLPLLKGQSQFRWRSGKEEWDNEKKQYAVEFNGFQPGEKEFALSILERPQIRTNPAYPNPPIGNPPGVPKEASELSKERKKEIRKKWLELVNMTATELQTFYDSDLGNKKAGLSREEAKEAGISSGRDSALAIIKMKQTPVKEWHKRHSKDRGRDIMLDFWQWAQKQINFNTRHRAMRGSYLDEKGRPKRKLLGLWIWGHDPWRYAIKVKSERLPKCPDVPWIGSAEKKRFGVLPKMNPKFKVLTGNIVTISGPSSAGKSTIAKALSEKMRANMVPSYMTREPRPNEQQGVDGFFVSVERFEDMINNGDFTTKEGVDLWVKQKNGEYYGRRVSDFMSSKAVVVDVNFEGLRKMRKAFPGRTYSVFIRTAQGPKRRRENLEKRGVHTEEEIESRVRAGTNMLQTFGKMNFDFIAANKFGEVEKNVAMIASEFKKWEKAPQNNPKFSKPSKRCSTQKPCGGKVIYKSMAAANKAINSGRAGGHTAYPSPQCQDNRNRRVYHTKTTSYMFNPPAIRMGAELLHKPSGEKLRYIEAEIDEDGKTWYVVEDMLGERRHLEDGDLEFYSLWPKSSLWQTNPPFDLQDIINVMAPSAIESLNGRIQRMYSGKPKRPIKPTIETAKALLGIRAKTNAKKTPEQILEELLFKHNLRIRRYKIAKQKYDSNLEKLKHFYGYGGESKTKMADAIINTIGKEFKGKPVITAYRAQFAFNIEKEQMLNFVRENGPGEYFSTWKQGADIYFNEFDKKASWMGVPGSVIWLITAEISVLDIDWKRTLRNRFQFPEEKELALLRSPMEQKMSSPYSVRNYVTVKRIDVWDAKAVAKYAQKFDISGGGMRRQPWLSSKLKPLVSHDLMMKANPPVGEFEGAMDMGIQKDGPSRYHGHYPSGVESFVPDMATQWKKKSFRVEMPLNSKAEADGTYTMGFLEKHEDDDRPYIVSIKYDGDNNILHFDGEETVIFTRRGRWRKDFHLTDQITASLKKNGVSSAIILGELYVVDQDGKTVPLSQQSSFTQAPKNLNMQESMRFAAFDILEINGKNIEDTPYVARMDILKPLIHGDAVKVVEHWRSKGGMNEVMEAWNEGISNDPNFEGLIVRFEGDKKSIKVKMHGTADLVVLGFYYGEEGGRDEAIVGGGALAWMDENGDFVLAGNSVLGSSIVEKAELLQRLLPTAVDAPKVKWGDHIVDRSITHDHRGRGAITPVEPHLIGEFKYRSLNYSERPVYRFEDGHYFQVGTKRAPVLFQCTFGRWRPDKSLTHQDLRMTQVAGEGEGKWKKNPHKQEGPLAWWEPDSRGHQIYNKSSSLQYINNQLVGDQNISRRDVFNAVATGVERKYGVRYQIVSPKEAEQIGYLKDMDAFFDGRNYGTWDEKNGVVYFNEEMFNDRKTALRELGHETGAVIIASMYGGKDNIPRADYHGMNSVKGLTHLVDSYTFGWFEPKPGQSKAIVRSNPPEDDDTNYPGGTAQFLMDGILLGSLKSKMNDWRTEGVSKTVTLKDWPIHYPELAARLEEAEKLGWSGFTIPKVKVNPPWAEDEDEEPPTPEEYSVPNEKGVVAQDIETQDEAESIALRWTNKTDEDFVAFEMIYTMPDGSRRWAVVRKPEGGKSGSPVVRPMRSSPHFLESANKYGLGPDCPRCGSNYTEKVGRVRVAVQDGPAHVMEGGYHCNYCGFDWDTESMDLVRLNPMAPGYQSYGWTTQDWRSIKVNNKGEIDYSEKCGAEGTQTASGKPRLCLPAIVVKSLIRTESGKEVIRKQARKKARAKKGERIPWHPRIKKLWKKLEEKTVEDRPKKNGVLPSKKGGTFPKAGYIYDPPKNEEYALHVEVQKNKRKYKKLVKDWMNKNHNASWSWAGDFKTEAEKKKFEEAKAYAKENIDGRMVCSVQCIACYYKQGGMKEAEIRERAKGVKENPPSLEFRGDDDEDIDYTFENIEDGGGVATYKATGEATSEDAREMVYRLWNDDPDWVKEVRDLATENEMTYFVQGKRIDDVTYQLIISASHVDDADLLDIVIPAIPTEFDFNWQKGIPNPPAADQAIEIPTVIVWPPHPDWGDKIDRSTARDLRTLAGSQRKHSRLAEIGFFLFGDNEARQGKGGQAKAMRGLDNAYGIRTKKRPSLDDSAFWSDKTYKTNIKMMSEDFLEAFMETQRLSKMNPVLYIPRDGIGTGMAQLKSRAPKTYKWLKTFLDNLIRTGNEQDVKDNIKKWRMK